MQLIPFKIAPDRYNLFIILEDSNIERMKKYDPAQFDTGKLPEEWQALKLNVVLIGYANERDITQVRRLVAQGTPAAALEFLSRGFQYRPDKGDDDAPYGRSH